MQVAVQQVKGIKGMTCYDIQEKQAHANLQYAKNDGHEKRQHIGEKHDHETVLRYVEQVNERQADMAV